MTEYNGAERSITTELREWLENAYTYGTGDDLFKKNYRPWFGWKLVLEPMLDRIDAEHESKVSYWQDASYKDGYDEGFASADDYFTDKRETLKEHGWVKLPVDADGVPIRVGDKMEPISVKYDRFGVVTLCLDTRDGRWSLLTDLDGDWSHDELCQLRHYTPPTVEDVLAEFADKVCNSGHQWGLDAADTIAEYAKRLRLAGDGE
jgi:hypothetical protein